MHFLSIPVFSLSMTLQFVRLLRPIQQEPLSIYLSLTFLLQSSPQTRQLFLEIVITYWMAVLKAAVFLAVVEAVKLRSELSLIVAKNKMERTAAQRCYHLVQMEHKCTKVMTLVRGECNRNRGQMMMMVVRERERSAPLVVMVGVSLDLQLLTPCIQTMPLLWSITGMELQQPAMSYQQRRVHPTFSNHVMKTVYDITLFPVYSVIINIRYIQEYFKNSHNIIIIVYIIMSM